MVKRFTYSMNGKKGVNMSSLRWKLHDRLYDKTDLVIHMDGQPDLSFLENEVSAVIHISQSMCRYFEFSRIEVWMNGNDSEPVLDFYPDKVKDTEE